LVEQDIPPNQLKALDELFDEAVEHGAPPHPAQIGRP
jgi:hypothetical protein